ncbi:PAS domain-containing protein [Aureimonas phyllosphaerae]|uniref:PAS domain-containing sensor histidine kinase n=1 Tax=Aureimonas phyllosphaerae TaxID=1166078 RepID=UPI003A5B9DC4
MVPEPFDHLPPDLLAGFVDCLWRMDRDGIVTAGGPIASHAADASAWAGRRFVECVDPQDRPRAERLWSEAVAGQAPVEGSLRLAADGGRDLFRLRLVPVTNGGWHGIGRRVSQDDLQAEAHRRLIETIDDGFCTLELIPGADGQPVDYRFLSVNPAFERQSGLADAAGRTALELVPELPQEWLKIYGRIARSGEAERFEEEQKSPHRFYEVYATPFDRSGLGRIAVLFRDILPRRKAEERLSTSERRLTTLVQGMPQLVWRASAAGRWTWASPQWAAYTGQAMVEASGFGWLKAVHPDDRQRVVTAWREAGARGEFRAEIRIRGVEEGAERWFQARALPVLDERGKVVEWIGTSTDVDEMHQLRGRQDVLLAELQHRTRNLLGVVTSVAERTARNAASLEDFLPRLRERLLALSRINGLLSQLDRGQRVTFDSLIRAELEARGFLDPDGDARVLLDGPDGVRLRSASVQTFALAIHELATNAVKYGALSQDEGRLAVHWRLCEADSGLRRLVVDWIESGPERPVAPPPLPGGGYGRELIEKALPYQLKARTTYEIGPGGVRCTIDLPVD